MAVWREYISACPARQLVAVIDHRHVHQSCARAIKTAVLLCVVLCVYRVKQGTNVGGRKAGPPNGPTFGRMLLHVGTIHVVFRIS